MKKFIVILVLFLCNLLLSQNQIIVGPQNDCALKDISRNVHTSSEWFDVNGVAKLKITTLQHRTFDKSRIYNQSGVLIWEWLGESYDDTWYSKEHFLNINTKKIKVEFTQGYRDPFCDGYVKVEKVSFNSKNSSSQNVNISSVPNVNNKNQNSCNFKFVIPKITWKLVDNRRKCSYCRAQYVPYSKVDLAEAKQIHSLQYLQGKLLKHWEAINASEEHKQNDRDKLKNVFRKNNYSEIALINAQMQEMIAPIIKSATSAKRAFLDNSLDNYYDFNTIYLHDVQDSKYCTRKCEYKDY